MSQEDDEILPLQADETVEDRKCSDQFMEELSEEKENERVPASDVLRFSPWTLLLAVTYATLSAFSWSILSILTYRPVTSTSYHTLPANIDRTRNENWLHTARVTQSIVGVLTIPVVSAVCSKAVVVFTQNVKRKNLSLRKTITLASRGWTEPDIIFRLCQGQYRRYGTSFLVFAIFLNVLGGSITPLPSIFLHYSTTKTPTSPSTIPLIPDVSDFFGPSGFQDPMNRVAIMTRYAITSTFSTDPQSRLWSYGSKCNNSLEQDTIDISSPSSAQLCDSPVANLANMSQLIDPFLAYLPAGFNTGLVKQYLPRLNSSVTRENITAAEFPENCDTLPGAFYVHYSHAGEANDTNYAGNWSVIACMPSNQSSSPWQNTRDRQDISESLYLNISMNTFTLRHPVEALLKTTMNSTLGYFELPNYFNGQKPGPLLNNSPWPGASQWPQIPPEVGHYRRDVNNGSAGMSNSSVLLQFVANKGPLLNIAMAMFGENSYIANRFQHPEVYIYNLTNTEAWAQIDRGANEDLYAPVCVEQIPLMGLLMGASTESTPWDWDDEYPGCITNMNNQDDTLQREVEAWLLSLYDNFSPTVITNAFEAAAFLANEAWLVKSVPDGGTLFVSYDLGVDTEVPVISEAGIILISVLLSIFLVALLSLAIYGAHTPTWTSSLDAFAMLRIGTSVSDKLSLTRVRNWDKITALDREPGWVGDITGGHGAVGELGLGADAQLTRKRRIRIYES